MENGWRGAPSQLPLKTGPANANTAVQRMLQEQEGKEPNKTFTSRLEPRRRAHIEWPYRVAALDAAVRPTARQYFSPSQRASTSGLKKVTWPPPLEDVEIEDGDQEPVYSQPAPAVNGFAPPTPQYAEQVSRQGRPQQRLPQTPPPQRRSASRDRSRPSPAWTPPPTVISLRQSPPIHQEPSPVFISQPATARMQASVQRAQANGAFQNGHLTSSASVSPVPGPGSSIPSKPSRVTARNRGDLKWPPEVNEIIPETISFEVPVAKMDEPILRQSGVRARGDAKWPPQEYKTRADEENAQRVALAKGPVCRPRLPKRDYSGFFDQNRVNSMYPGYRAPPGTQHYCDETGVSEF